MSEGEAALSELSTRARPPGVLWRRTDWARRLAQEAQIFADERGRLEQQWSRGGGVSTEDPRVALQRHRSFFTRLLAI